MLRLAAIVLGVQAYQTPDGERVDLPAHYDNVWMQEGGDVFILSNDPGFDPNVGATTGFDRLEPMR